MLAGATVTETTGIPVPLNPTVVALPVEELLVITRLPLTSPAPPGVKLTFSTVDWPGSNVTGKVAPETEKPTPLAVVAVTVTGRSPLEVRVRGRVEFTPTATFPKDRLSGLTLSVGTAEASCSVKLFEAPPAGGRQRYTLCCGHWRKSSGETRGVGPLRHPDRGRDNDSRRAAGKTYTLGYSGHSGAQSHATCNLACSLDGGSGATNPRNRRRGLIRASCGIREKTQKQHHSEAVQPTQMN